MNKASVQEIIRHFVHRAEELSDGDPGSGGGEDGSTPIDPDEEVVPEA